MASKKKSVFDIKRSEFMKYWGAHPNYTAVVHVMLGVGLGLLGQTFVDAGYINTLGWMLVFFGVVGHFYPFVA